MNLMKHSVEFIRQKKMKMCICYFFKQMSLFGMQKNCFDNTDVWNIYIYFFLPQLQSTVTVTHSTT